MFAMASSSAMAGQIQEPPAFSSAQGVLDLLMVAQPTKLNGLTTPGFAPIGWAYRVCPRPKSGDDCPAGTATPYGGVRLALQQGDTLKIRLVNKLPAMDPALVDRAGDDPLLPLNPTNLHTHGLIVDATPNTAIPPAVPVYGDFVFTSVFNPANGIPEVVNPAAAKTLHAHGDVVRGGVVDYNIPIPANHPSGSFWFHPHVHGISVNQISAGLAGIITIGKLSGYACGDNSCKVRLPDTMQRHLILKEMQVLPDASGGTPQLQTEPEFCAPTMTADEINRNGVCAAVSPSPAGANWFFTVNGQQFPTIPVSSPDGEIWRIQNASASVSYDLTLVDNIAKTNMVMQLLSMDGVTVNVPAGTVAGSVVRLGGSRFKYAACPTTLAANASPGLLTAVKAAGPSAFGGPAPTPICVTELVMMPSSRAEVWVSYRDSAGRLRQPVAGASATFKTSAYATGPIGDTWPEINLARVEFSGGGSRSFVADAVRLDGYAWRNRATGGIFTTANTKVKTAPLPAKCVALAPGHRRRIYFGNPGTGTDDAGNPIFGLGYEEIDQNGIPVPGTLVEPSRFDPLDEICLPLGPGNMPVNETWELVNLAGELHNFHIHQTKFKVISGSAPAGSVLAANSTHGAGIEVDNIPVPFSAPVDPFVFPDSGSCAIADFKSGRCAVTPITVSIPFAKVGKFVYHCHILEHEDGGMMHAIRVAPAPR